MHALLRHKFLIGVVAVIVAASAGGAYAATQSGSDSRQAFLNDVAKRLNVTPSQLRTAVRGALLDRLEAAVKAGRLTQAQADRLKQRIEQGGGLRFGLGGGLRFGPGGGMPFGPGKGAFRHRWFGPAGPPGVATGPGLLHAAATYLGLSDARLFNDLRAGKTLAQVAQGQNKSVTGLDQALVAAAKARLDALVAARWITKAQEQRKLNHLNARIDRLVNQARLASPGDPPGPADLPAPAAPPPPGSPPAPGAPPPPFA